MISADALEAIKAGVRGVHVVFCGSQPYEATGVFQCGGEPWVTTQHLDGSEGPRFRAAGEAIALWRLYEQAEDVGVAP